MRIEDNCLDVLDENHSLLWLFQIPSDQHKQIRRCLVTAGEATIEGLKMAPTHCALYLLGATTFLQQSP